MRRRLGRFIPIVLLAVLVQFLAPIGAFRAVASAVSDPLTMASICAGTAGVEDGQPAPANMAHAGCCAVCTAGHGGVMPVDVPTVAFVRLQRQYQLIVWLQAQDIPPHARVGSNAQARAPPAIS